MKPTMGSLFAGIGGFDLGFEWAGFEVAWQVEIDPYCRKVLARHFPHAERFEDVREVGKHNLRPVDVICGGFPCQDVSVAQATPKGIEGQRSGLVTEMVRVIRELRPRYAVMENVPALLARGFGKVLALLAESGYDAEWHCVSAAGIGLPHLRERLWIIAYAQGERVVQGRPSWCRDEAGFAMPPSVVRIPDWAEDSAALRGADDGLPGKLDRGHALGNAVVPQIPEMIARRIATRLCEVTA